jgi:hypothetical protein
MIRTMAVIICVVNLSACGTYGEPLILSAWYDRIDQCQTRGRVNYQLPAYCGSGVYSTHRTRIYDNAGRPVGYTR